MKDIKIILVVSKFSVCNTRAALVLADHRQGLHGREESLDYPEITSLFKGSKGIEERKNNGKSREKKRGEKERKREREKERRREERVGEEDIRLTNCSDVGGPKAHRGP
jgi:hypothetical protein